MKTRPPAPAEGAFIACLQGLQAGTSLATLDHELTELVKAVLLTRRKGKITLTISVRPNAKHGVKVLDESKITMPKEDSSESFFYTNADGQLLQNNPDQAELALVADTNPAQQPIDTAV